MKALRLGVLADIHGNLHALERVLDCLATENVDKYICAGDLVGYGPHPNECVARMENIGALCVAGNHDLIALERLSAAPAGQLARRTLQWTRTELTSTNADFLGALPLVAELEAIVAGHGSLEDPSVYVTPERASAQLDRLRTAYRLSDTLVLGHIHKPLAYGDRRGALLVGRSGSVKLHEGERHLLNPGSVGQSRERRVVARFLVLDLEDRWAHFREVAYDHRACNRALRRRGLPRRTYHRNPKGLRARAGRLRGRLRRAVGH